MTFTKERIIEELKASTQNASGMFEISEDTICNLMSLLTTEVKPVIIVGDDAGDALAYRRLIQSFAPGTKLYTAPPAPEKGEE